METLRPVIALPTLRCNVCNHIWIPRHSEAPRRCANKDCRSARWHEVNGRRKKRKAA